MDLKVTVYLLRAVKKSHTVYIPFILNVIVQNQGTTVCVRPNDKIIKKLGKTLILLLDVKVLLFH